MSILGRFDVSRIVIHIDLDAFYASVVEHEDPSLKAVPLIIGEFVVFGVHALNRSGFLFVTPRPIDHCPSLFSTYVS